MYVTLIKHTTTWIIDRVPTPYKKDVLTELNSQGLDGHGNKLAQ